MPMAHRLFGDLRARTKDTLGVTRPSYGEGEQIAHDLAAAAARSLDLEVSTDFAGNLYMTLPGDDREISRIITGSHLDSVPQGGNYDGAAGVVAGLTAVAALKQAGYRPPRDLTVMGIRAEESSWFPLQHVGSRAALGLLTPGEVDSARRADTKRTLAEHMTEMGFDPEPLRWGERAIDPATVHAYFEVHIEQGPILVHEGLPLGIVTGIRGNIRAREAICLGQHAHSGAVPRHMRHDAVMAMADYAGRLERAWARMEAKGADLVLTFGKFYTDPESHTHSRVPGEVRFTIDLRSHQPPTLETMEKLIFREAKKVGERRGVDIDLGTLTHSKPAVMDDGLRDVLHRGCDALGLAAMDIASGGGHDAGDFAGCGVPSAMIFIRNDHGSHNPDEHMEMDDFEKSVCLLAWGLREASAA